MSSNIQICDNTAAESFYKKADALRLENLYKEGITTITNAKCVEIKDKAVVIDKEGALEEIPCDSVVVSIGSRARDYDEISVYCGKNNIPCHTIGDAVKARRALNCIKEAVDVAREI